MSKVIPLSEPNFSKEDRKLLLESFDSTFISSSGKFLDKFEDKIAKMTRSECCTLTTNGTSAIHLGLKALGVKEGDEVICPSLTFIASINPILYLNASPIFMDSDEYFCMDLEKLKHFLTKHTYTNKMGTFNKITKKRISSLILVHVWGNAGKAIEIVKECKKRKIKVLEDATESLGTKIKKENLYTGTIGDVGCYSFNGNKIITAGGGGAVVSKNKNLINKIKFWSTQSKSDPFNYIHNELGFNYRLSNMQAAIGLSQLKRLRKIINQKKELRKYTEKALHSKGYKLYELPPYSDNNCWLFVMKCKSSERMKLLNKLNSNNVMARPVWGLCHKQRYTKQFQSFEIEKSEKLLKESICLPSSSGLTKAQINFYVNLL